MVKFSGNINVNGKIAFVPQQAWIQNTTIKNNITFDELFDKEYYDKCVYSCALNSDLDLFAAKDETEIGEKVVLKTLRFKKTLRSFSAF